MSTIQLSQQDLIILKRHVLGVTLICYFPHIITEPLWLFIIFLGVIGYRLVADYFSYPALSRTMRFILVVGCLLLMFGSVHSGQFIVQFLLIFIILKCLEVHTIRDIKVLILCNFFLICSALIVVQDIWMIIYLFVGILANLSIMLKLSAPQATLRQISIKSSRQLLIVIPISIVLFYVFPRIDPLWRVPSFSKSGSTGFSEKMNFGSIAELFNDDSTVMQISFKNKPVLNGYWRGLLLSYYSGESWNPTFTQYDRFFPVRGLGVNEIADYEILLEPTKTKWLFYTGFPVASSPNLLFSFNHGLIQQNKEPITKRFAYSLKTQSIPYSVLNKAEYTETTQLPNKLNPRLHAWAKIQFEKMHNDVSAFINFLRDYIYQQPFWYTLTPPTLNANRNQMDSFWFDTKKGFCEHYASAMVFILRSVGVPARIVVGYQGGQWNPISHTILIQQNNAHAWVEYWREGVGWQQMDPTLFIAPVRIDATIRNRQVDLSQQNNFNIAGLPWLKKIRFFSQSMQFFYERWFLFYNRNSQQDLLENIGFGKWKKEQLLQASIGCMILFLIILGMGYRWRKKQIQDRLVLEYHLLQNEFRKFNISTSPSITLEQQCKSLILKVPDLASLVENFVYRYENLRLKQLKENKKETIALFKTLRYSLRRRYRS